MDQLFVLQAALPPSLLEPRFRAQELAIAQAL